MSVIPARLDGKFESSAAATSEAGPGRNFALPARHFETVARLETSVEYVLEGTRPESEAEIFLFSQKYTQLCRREVFSPPLVRVCFFFFGGSAEPRISPLHFTVTRSPCFSGSALDISFCVCADSVVGFVRNSVFRSFFLFFLACSR